MNNHLNELEKGTKMIITDWDYFKKEAERSSPSIGRRWIEKTSNKFDSSTQYIGSNAASKEQKQELQFWTISGYQVLHLIKMN